MINNTNNTLIDCFIAQLKETDMTYMYSEIYDHHTIRSSSLAYYTTKESLGREDHMVETILDFISKYTDINFEHVATLNSLDFENDLISIKQPILYTI